MGASIPTINFISQSIFNLERMLLGLVFLCLLLKIDYYLHGLYKSAI